MWDAWRRYADWAATRRRTGRHGREILVSENEDNVRRGTGAGCLVHRFRRNPSVFSLRQDAPDKGAVEVLERRMRKRKVREFVVV